MSKLAYITKVGPSFDLDMLLVPLDIVLVLGYKKV